MISVATQNKGRGTLSSHPQTHPALPHFGHPRTTTIAYIYMIIYRYAQYIPNYTHIQAKLHTHIYMYIYIYCAYTRCGHPAFGTFIFHFLLMSPLNVGCAKVFSQTLSDVGSGLLLRGAPRGPPMRPAEELLQMRGLGRCGKTGIFVVHANMKG